jgi:hypothetical protein
MAIESWRSMPPRASRGGAPPKPPQSMLDLVTEDRFEAMKQNLAALQEHVGAAKGNLSSPQEWIVSAMERTLEIRRNSGQSAKVE